MLSNELGYVGYKMGLPSRWRDYTQKLLTHYSAGNLRWRGLIHPVDIFAYGTERFAKKLGSELPVLVADNSMRLDGRTKALSTSIKVNALLLRWMALGGYISIAGREYARILDWDEDTNTIQLETPTRITHLDRDMVFLFSVPIRVSGAYSIGATILVLRTKHILVVGDSILLNTQTESDASFLEYQITRIALQEDSDGDGIYTWQVYLDRGIDRAVENDDILQLKAYPAYQSRLLKLPTLEEYNLYPPYHGSGPLLLDWMSGSLVEQTEYEEVFAYQARSVSGDPLVTDEPIVGTKNEFIWRVPIAAHSMLFWDVGLGSVTYGRKYFPPKEATPFSGISGVGNPNGIVIGFGSPTSTIYQELVTGKYFKCISIPTGTNWVLLENQHTTHMLIIEPHNYHEVADSFNGKWFMTQDCVPPIKPQEGKKSTGSIKCITVAQLINNDHFILDDGLTSITFEYKVTDPFTPTLGAITIDVSSLVTADEVAILTATIVDASGLQIDVEVSSPFVLFTNQNEGVLGNQVIVDGVTNTEFAVFGMVNGVSGGIEWLVKVYPEVVPATIRVRLYPNDWQEFIVSDPLAPESGSYLPISLLETSEPITRIDIATQSLPVRDSVGRSVLLDNQDRVWKDVNGSILSPASSSGALAWEAKTWDDRHPPEPLSLINVGDKFIVSGDGSNAIGDWDEKEGYIATCVGVSPWIWQFEAPQEELVIWVHNYYGGGWLVYRGGIWQVEAVKASKIWWGNWEFKGSRVASITYTLMARVMDEYTWSSTFLFVKPYFMLLDYLEARHETARTDGALLQL